MAQVTLGILGSTFLGPFGGFAGSFIGGLIDRELLFKKDPVVTEGPRLTDLHIQTASYGEPIYKVYGTVRVAGNIIWVSDIFEQKTTWGAGGQHPTVQYNYYLNLLVSVCQGIIDNILRIWANGDLVYDNRGNSFQAISAPTSNWIGMRMYRGTEDQVLDTDIGVENEDDFGIDSNLMPDFRGLACVQFDDLKLGKFFNRIPNLEFEVSTSSGRQTVCSSIADVAAAASSADLDNIVFYPDGVHYCIAVDQTWYRINTIEDSIVSQSTHESPDIPYLTGGFDIDESDIIYTCKQSDSGFAVLCRLDGHTFAEIDAADHNQHFTERLRVFRSVSFPYAIWVQGGTSGGKLYITHRSNYTFKDNPLDIAPDELELDPPTGCEWMSVDLDHESGTIWAVCRHASGGNDSVVVKLIVQSNGSYTREEYDVTNHIHRAEEIIFDSSSDQLVLGSSYTNKIAFLNASSPTDKLGDIHHSDSVAVNGKSAWRRGVAANGLFYFTSTPSMVTWEIDVGAYEVRDSWDLGSDCICDTVVGSCYDVVTHAMILACPDASSGSDYMKVLLNRGYNNPVRLSTIVTDICSMAGLSESDIDVDDLTDLVYGYVINERMTARAALQPLMEAYLFDAVDTGGKIKFVKRGGASVVTIPEEDLGASIGKPTQRLTITRQQEIELPASVVVEYMDVDANYEIGLQSERRLITQSVEERVMRLPIAMTADEAKQLCVKHLSAAWIQRTRYTFSTTRKYSWLDPADVITVTEGGIDHLMRITEMSYGGGVVQFKSVAEDVSSYTSDAGGVDLPGDEQDVNYPGPTLLVLIDCPLVVSTNNTPGLYIATLGYLDAWEGAGVFKSADGQNWNFRPDWMSFLDAKIAKASSVLADVVDPFIWDEGNTVTVQMIDGSDSLISATEAEVLNGANMAILGDELIQWKTATFISTGKYQLSGLLRGRKGSEWATGSHAIGDYFIPISTDNVNFVEFPVDDLNVPYWYRAQSSGTPEVSEKQVFTNTIRNMKPLSPQHVAATRDGSGNITITWIRRTRIGGEWTDGGDAPLGETTEAYEVDVYDGSTVVRTLEVTEESATYTAAQQTMDFGSPQSSIDVIVYQISSVVDRGFETEATV